MLSVKPVKNLIFLQDRFDIDGKTSNIAIQLVLHQCCWTRCMLFAVGYTVHLSSLGHRSNNMNKREKQKERIFYRQAVLTGQKPQRP